ncbi:hypothetical protein D9758_005182 [Tetrapyrgos nigripes]|uniref:Uncharacterized protein n=1 Tax=Tetrapyrgos nigripes TaxID=182062 RepID=A0A8H5LX38_9AGAR|nr:hypothetical protein D9758_005182 [Tetrapyrgos nigripes]
MHSTITTTTTNVIRSSSKMAARKLQPALPVMSRNKSSSLKGIKEACATELAELRRTASRLSGAVRTLSSTGIPKKAVATPKSPIISTAAFEDKSRRPDQVAPSVQVVTTKPVTITAPKPGDRCEEKKVIYMINAEIKKIQASRANAIAELSASFAQSYTKLATSAAASKKPTPSARSDSAMSTSTTAVVFADASKPMTVWTDAIEFFSKENVDLVNSYSRVTNVVDELPSDIIIEDPGRVRPRYHVSSDKKVHQRHMEAFWSGGFGF